MYVLIRNLEEKRKTELLEVVKQKDLAIEILCKSKLDYNYLMRMKFINYSNNLGKI